MNGSKRSGHSGARSAPSARMHRGSLGNAVFDQEHSGLSTADCALAATLVATRAYKAIRNDHWQPEQTGAKPHRRVVPTATNPGTAVFRR